MSSSLAASSSVWLRPQPQKQSSGYFDEHFERLRPFGQGAFGEVWCCKDHLDREPCAVKAVRYKGGTGVEMSVIREAQILAGMDHPNIVRCDHAWIQTDTVDGDTTAGSTRASSWPSTPMTPFALAPHFHRDAPNSEPPHLKLTEGGAGKAEDRGGQRLGGWVQAIWTS
ncbi:eIF-2-alpha kinase GCN2 (serine/threonine-protein kinase GCN2) [Durusdinium trenchii]|uniref:EIF-2-alpha kinase GCN2 (Serine/threonine-protein kinase GCN2) n=1 Tax=Durusdinium trenchii TaxID=1381693 RepID=A0ABP0RTY6_9DINO